MIFSSPSHLPRWCPGLLLLLLMVFTACQQHHPAEADVRLTATGSHTAGAYFEEGLLLLHSFEYEDAREAFQKAQSLDSGMAMAYWGEAMTYNHPLWRQQDFTAARQVIARMEDKAALANLSPLEKDLIAGLRLLYEAQQTKAERDEAYAGYMAGLYKRYPHNHEVAAFYALALLGKEEGRNEENYGKAARIAQGIISENPNHPGALHYRIHSYDDPKHAHLALQAASTYDEVAPYASHALHMPSHIYVALGMWDEVVRCNERSYQASVKRMQDKALDNDARGYHAYHWLQYGYLQQGRRDTARQLLLEMERYASETPSRRARGHLIYLLSTYLVESDSWQSPFTQLVVDLSDLNVAVRSQYHFSKGMAAFKRAEVTLLQSAIDSIAQGRASAARQAREKDLKLCMGSSRRLASSSDLAESGVMEHQLRALLAWLSKDKQAAEEWLQKAVQKEAELDYSFGPPSIPKPSRELYAEWLLAHDRLREAEQQYKKALERGPGRRLASEGLANARQYAALR